MGNKFRSSPETVQLDNYELFDGNGKIVLHIEDDSTM